MLQCLETCLPKQCKTPCHYFAGHLQYLNENRHITLQVDVVGKSNQMLAVPMLSLSLAWAAKLKGNQLGQPLSELLADCCQRLRAHFAQFILDRVSMSDTLQCHPAVNLMLLAACNNFVVFCECFAFASTDQS